jgi:tRNA(adenine34) deaminase
MQESTTDDIFWMQQALELAKKALDSGDVPIGALVVSKEGSLLGEGWNTRERDQDPCGHAEVNALRAASQKQGSWYLQGCTLYVTLEPCAMCAGAMVLARIERCVFGASDPKGGFVGSLGQLHQHPGLNHRFEVTPHVLAEEGGEFLKSFFKELRAQKRAEKINR